MTMPSTRTIFRLGFKELLKQSPADAMGYIAHDLAKDAPDGREFAQALLGIMDACKQVEREKESR